MTEGRNENPPPERFRNIMLAKWIGIPPWELEKAPSEWCDWIVMFIDVDREVSPILSERARLKAQYGAQ